MKVKIKRGMEMSKKDYTVLPIRFDNKMYNEMRDIAHVNKISMSDIVRHGVDLFFREQKKILTKRDIAI